MVLGAIRYHPRASATSGVIAGTRVTTATASASAPTSTSSAPGPACFVVSGIQLQPELCL